MTELPPESSQHAPRAATWRAAAVVLAALLAWFAPVLLPGPAPVFGRTLLSLDERICPPFVQDADPSVATRPQNFVTSDLQGWILSHARTASARLRAGELPLWDERELLGRPLHGDASFPTFYAPDWVYLVLDPVRAYAVSSAFHVVLAAVGMLLLLRRSGVAPLAAAVGALAFAGGGWMAVHLHIPHFVRSAAWFPWLLLASAALAANPGPRRAALLALALAFATLAGYPQVLGLMLFGGALAAVIGVARSPRRGAAAAWHALALTVGLAAGAVELLPIAELRAQSLRAANLPDAVARTKSLRPIHLVSLIAPDFQGHPVALQQAGMPVVEEWPPAREFFGAEIQDNYVEDSLYAGVVVLLLAFVAVVASPRRGLAAGFAAFIAIGLLVAAPTPLQSLFRNVLIPGLGAGSPKRALLLLAPGFAGLAALGFETLQVGSRRARATLLGGGLLVAGLCIVGWGVSRAFFETWSGPRRDPARDAESARLLLASFAVPAALALAAAALAPAFAPERRPRVARIAALLLALLAAGDLAWFATRFNPFQPPAAAARPTAVVDFLTRPENRGRTLRFPSRQLLPASLVSQWGVASVDGIQALIVREVGELLDALEPGVIDAANPNQVGSFDGVAGADAGPGRPPDPAFLARPLVALLARWIVVQQPLPPELGFTLRYEGPREGLGLYEVPNALPDAFFVAAVHVESDRARRLAQLVAPDFAAARVAVVDSEEDVAALPASAHVASTSTTGAAPSMTAAAVTGGRVTPERIELHGDFSVPGVVVINQAWFPGWTVAVDGQPARAIRVDHAFLGVVVPAGSHAVVVSYEPRPFRLGAWISGVAAVLLLGLFVGRVPWRFRASSPTPPDPSPGTTALAPRPPG